MGWIVRDCFIWHRNKDIREAPTVFLAAGTIMTMGLPNDVINAITVIVDLLPEEMFRKQIRLMYPAMKPFPFNKQV